MTLRRIDDPLELADELGRELGLLEDLPDERVLVPDLLRGLVFLALILVEPVEVKEALDDVGANEPRLRRWT
jgi:hypothetical protein